MIKDSYYHYFNQDRILTQKEYTYLPAICLDGTKVWEPSQNTGDYKNLRDSLHCGCITLTDKAEEIAQTYFSNGFTLKELKKMIAKE